VALLPNPELFKVLHRAAEAPSLSVYLQLITENCRHLQGTRC
jgi:hypothetical protein